MTQFLLDIVRYIPIPLYFSYLALSTWIVHKFPLGGHRSISDHIGHSGRYFKISAATFSITAVGLCLNVLFWIIPQYNGTTAYGVLTLFFLLAGFGLSWFPADVAGSKKREHMLHVVSVFILYVSIIAFSAISIFATSTTAPVASAVAQSTVVIYVWLMLLYLLYKPSHNHFVFYETIGISTFFLLFIVLAIGM
jgi:hypothetical protein